MAGRLMAQPVYPQLRKYPVRPGTYVSCQMRTFRRDKRAANAGP